MRNWYDEVMSLSLRRGFLWPAADIYGGFAGFYDYGHLGALMKRKWENRWIDFFLKEEDNYHLIDTTNVLPYSCLKASGHVDHFTDVMTRCSKCNEYFKADQLIQDRTGQSFEGSAPEELDKKINELGLRCPKCGGSLEKSTPFNMMFPLSVGPTGADKAFLRPETAQGAYLSFKREFEALRRKMPLGLAIIGRAFRNEISPRQGAYRMREFLQAELQIFFDPASFSSYVNFDAVKDYPLRISFLDDMQEGTIREIKSSEAISKELPEFFVFHMAKVQKFYLDVLGFPKDRFRFAELGEKERAFYNKLHYDIQINMKSLDGFKEVAGIHYRTDHDLKGHQEVSHEKLYARSRNGRFIPHVLELSFGIDRNIWALLDVFYEKNSRSILRVSRTIAPVQLGVFPLVSKDGLPEKAREIYRKMRKVLDCFYDDSGSIGRRYARMDEVGTPLCLTVDYESLERDDVTVRDRDTTAQVRMKTEMLPQALRRFYAGEIGFDQL